MLIQTVDKWHVQNRVKFLDLASCRSYFALLWQKQWRKGLLSFPLRGLQSAWGGVMCCSSSVQGGRNVPLAGTRVGVKNRSLRDPFRTQTLTTIPSGGWWCDYIMLEKPDSWYFTVLFSPTIFLCSVVALLLYQRNLLCNLYASVKGKDYSHLASPWLDPSSLQLGQGFLLSLLVDCCRLLIYSLFGLVFWNLHFLECFRMLSINGRIQCNEFIHWCMWCQNKNSQGKWRKSYSLHQARRAEGCFQSDVFLEQRKYGGFS